MIIKGLKGLKYPDEYVIKFFFRENLHKNSGKVIEFGCSNGNNLSLYFQYDYDIVGIDLAKESIENANYNFKNIYSSSSKFKFISNDMLNFVKENNNISADIFTIPNVISYISKADFIDFLKYSKKNNLYKKDAKFFLRTRTKKDYRYGNGKEVSKDSFLIDYDITGEQGALCTCYSEYELIELLKKYLNLKDFTISHLDSQNLQNGKLIFNSDIAIWGTIS
jgi:hypothetical protein